MRRQAWMVLVAVFLFAGIADAANYTIEVSRKWYGKPYIKIVAQNGKTVAHGENLENFSDAIDTARNLSEGEFEIVDAFHK